MHAGRLERPDTGPGDRPCTLHAPQASWQIFSCKLILVTRGLMGDAVHEDQGEAKRQNSDGNTQQHEKGPNEFEYYLQQRALLSCGTRSFG
jgi:hypothetical protein